MTKKKNRNIWLVLVLVIIVALVIIFATTSTSNKNTIKIGVIADLSGDYASFLRGVPHGTELAKLDLENKDIKFIIEDQQSCNSQETTKIINKFLNLDKVDAIIGSTCSSTTLAVAPIVEKSKTIMISAVSSASSISYSGDYIFRTYMSDVLRAEKIAELAYDLKYKNIATITDITNDMTIEFNKGIKNKLSELGIDLVIEEQITNDNLDFRTILTKIKSKNADCIILNVTSSTQMGLIINQAKELDLNVKFMSSSETVEDQQIIDIAKDLANGIIYVMPGNAPITTEYIRLEEVYKSMYDEPIPSYTLETYDAIMLAIEAIEISDGSKEDIKNQLYEVSKTYQGVSGDVTFDQYGDVDKDVMFKVISNGEFVVYSN